MIRRRDVAMALAFAAAVLVFASGASVGREPFVAAVVDDVVDVVRAGIRAVGGAEATKVDDTINATVRGIQDKLDAATLSRADLDKMSTEVNKLFDDVPTAGQAERVAKLRAAVNEAIKKTPARVGDEVVQGANKVSQLIRSTPVNSRADLLKLGDEIKRAQPNIATEGMRAEDTAELFKKFPPSLNSKAYGDFYKKVGLVENGKPKNVTLKEWVKSKANWAFLSAAGATVIGLFFFANEIRQLVKEVKEENSGGGGGDSGGGGGEDGDGGDGKGGTVMLIVGIVILVVVLGAGSSIAVMMMQ